MEGKVEQRDGHVPTGTRPGDTGQAGTREDMGGAVM